jgi:hypothetical protein
VLRNEDIVAPGKAPYRMERPKIFKCPGGQQKHVMWFHCDSPSFSLQSVGVLTADSVEGPYTFAAPCFQPDGRRSYDMGTLVDDGPGVPEEIRDRIFYPLVSGREGGSGLGLTLAQTFVQQHGGLIECDSQPGRTDFRILLPLP